jgi:signal transduction histidine kinase
VLVNLVSNAVRAVAESTSKTRTIAITATCDSNSRDRVTWEIEDTGVGIAPDHIERIFEYGFTTKTSGQGGFGLHNSALAAERMTGSLRARSAGVGRGARFVLEFPHAPPGHSQPRNSIAS